MKLIRKMLGLEKRSGLHPGDPALGMWLGVGSTTPAGISVTPENARSCPEVDACVGLIEDTIATVPLDLFKRTGKGERERAVGHPLHDLLHDKPNSWQTSAEFRQMMEGWRSTHGNAYARIMWRGDSIPEALEPIHPSEMKPFRTPKGGVAYRWTPANGPTQTLMQMEVLHLRDKPANRFNLLEGQSRVERHRDSIGLALATSEYLSRFFKNNAVPKTFLEFPRDVELTQEQIQKTKEQFEQRHGGVENAWKIGVIQGGATIKTLGQTNSDAAIIQSHDMALAKIARGWGVPLHLIFEMSKSTSWGTGIEQQSIGFISYYMRPKFVMWEQALNCALMSRDMGKEFFFEFNIDGLLRGDFKTRMEGYALLVQWGISTVNEIRKLMNLSPVDGGDERLHPLNMAPASRIMDVLMRNQNKMNEDQATRLLASLVNSVTSPAQA